ncbi:hypothetical protein BH10PSE12_BH10PSE12_01770 [soil metagenome]
MIILAYIAIAILLIGAVAFGTLIVMSTIGHRRAWVEYKEHSREMIARQFATSENVEPDPTRPRQL